MLIPPPVVCSGAVAPGDFSAVVRFVGLTAAQSWGGAVGWSSKISQLYRITICAEGELKRRAYYFR